MFQLIIILCRYLFIFYIAFFLWQGVEFLLSERGLRRRDGKTAAALQRVMIVMTHLTAFAILVYDPATASFKLDAAVTGLMGLAFILLGMVFTGLVYKKSCPLLWNGMFFLLDIGIIMIARLSPADAGKQLMYNAVGLACVLLAPLVLKIFSKSEKLEIVYMIAGLAILALPFFVGVSKFGSNNWISLWGFNFQPSEAVKFLLIFYLASVFNRETTFKRLIFPGAVTAVYIGVLFIQNDLGTALIFFMGYMIMAYIACGSELFFIGGLLAASGAMWVAYNKIAHFQTRVVAWLNPWSDPYDKGYQILQSLFAIGTWGLLGSGLTRGVPQLVPVVGSDFVFSGICEEFGSLFGVGLICVFVMIFYRGVNIGLRCTRRYTSLLATGFTCVMAFQTFLILGGVIKMIPMTGVTLPFISAGGSSVVVCMAMIGIIQWANKESNLNQKREKRLGAEDGSEKASKPLKKAKDLPSAL
ncbi:MAG: FtsW/RodA/SpoVE family cell cycle protein [Defluviitaleaceae bacterium]|nr:FtsW/RodA/SpoVE family cell cycle protein [Defluviitaleaceae bacterium]